MGRIGALALMGGALIVAGLLLGFSGAGADCGSVFAPDFQTAQINDVMVGFGYEDDCRDALSTRKPLAYGALGAGVLALIGSFMVTEPARRESVG